VLADQQPAWPGFGPVDWNQGRVYPASPEWDPPMKIKCLCCALTVLLAGLSMSSPSHAAESLPDSLVKSNKASEGKTEVATSGFEKADKAKPDSKDATELEISAGGLASAGNSRSIAATSAGKFRLRRGSDQVGAGIAANYAESQVTKGEGLQPTVENFQGKLRYDRFLAGPFTVFGSVSARHDRFQGLELRINLDPGFGYYFIDEEEQQLWLEGGYDFQHDVRTDDAIADSLANNYFLNKTNDRHSGRGFVGYTSVLNDSVKVTTGLEYLQGLGHATNYRFNWDGAVTSAVGKSFSIATAVSVRYDHNPIPGIENTDIITSISLVYHLL
jgi:putative salt-induced outer membrane protein